MNAIHDHLDFNNMCNYHDLTSYERLVNSEQGVKVLHINARSITGKFDEIKTLIKTLHNKIDVLCITETWLNDDDKELFQIDGYRSYHLVRTSREHGGVSIFVSNRFKSKPLVQHCVVDDDIEMNTVQVTTLLGKIIICAIYRPNPDSYLVETFTTRLNDILSDNVFRKNKTVLIGDININLLTRHKPIFNYFTVVQLFSIDI